MHDTFLSIKHLRALLDAGKVSCEELVCACLERVASVNPQLNAVLEVTNTAREEARAMDRARKSKGPLAGIPLLVKDNIVREGQQATAGSQILEGYIGSYDATAVRRLKEAGAIIMGRTNMDEFAMGSSNESSHFGPVKNPWDLERVPGGSSGGSASAVAAGFSPAALGSDTGGSVRQPAALCGVTGLKPTYGRVSRFGLMALASSLDVIGPLTHTVEDAALVLQAMEGLDPRDATSASGIQTFIPALASPGVKGMRIGIPKEYFLDGMDGEVRQAVEDAVRVLESGGAQVKEVSLPHSVHALETYYVIMPCEASSNLARYDGVRYGYSSAGASLAETYARTRGEGFGAETKRRIMLGTFSLSHGYYDAYYRQAVKVRELIAKEFESVFQEVDLLACPTSPTTAWRLGEKFNDPLTMYLSDVYTVSANLAGIPALSVPCGFVRGLPVGLQLMAGAFDEASLFRAGMYYQQETDWHERHPEL